MLRSLALAVAVMAGTWASAASAQRGPEDWRPERRAQWESLGAAEIGTALERDTIHFGGRDDRFRAIGFTVNGNDVRIESLRIVFRDGEAQDVPVRELVKSGTKSKPIDLEGRGGRAIERIEVLYRSAGPVKIEFFGEPRPREARWEELGCQKVDFLEDEDTIRVGRREGRFSALKLRVTESRLRLISMKVVFGDGSEQLISVRSVIPDGAETSAIDLEGRNRSIDHIELKYLPQLSVRKGANVCVLGLEADRDGWRR
jgi:hypothetical protein